MNPINIGELKKLLEDYPDDMPILLSRDEEGNGFGKLHTVEEYIVMGEGYEVNLIDDQEIEDGVYDETDLEGTYRAIVLWP